MGSLVYSAADRLAAWLLPPRCVLCRGAGRARGVDLCPECSAELPRLASSEAVAPLEDASLRAPVRCVAACRYEFPLADLVAQLKYGGALANARVLGDVLAQAVVDCGAKGTADLVVPMPLHVERLVERGYNQSHEVARCLVRRLRIGLEPRALARTRATPPQVGLSRDARRANLRDAFRAEPARIAARRIALLDDVVTTGSTAIAAAAALQRAGADDVQVWCLARAGRAAD